MPLDLTATPLISHVFACSYTQILIVVVLKHESETVTVDSVNIVILGCSLFQYRESHARKHRCRNLGGGVAPMACAPPKFRKLLYKLLIFINIIFIMEIMLQLQHQS